MIHLIKDHGGHNHFVDFEDLTHEQISEILTMIKAKIRATVPSVAFPEGSVERTDKYTKLVTPKYFFSKVGYSRDLTAPKAEVFKVLGEEVLNKIASHEKYAIESRLAALDKEANEAYGERSSLAERKKYLDAFVKAAIEVVMHLPKKAAKKAPAKKKAAKKASAKKKKAAKKAPAKKKAAKKKK